MKFQWATAWMAALIIAGCGSSPPTTQVQGEVAPETPVAAATGEAPEEPSNVVAGDVAPPLATGPDVKVTEGTPKPAVEAPTPKPVATGANADLAGKWKGEIKLPAKSDDPQAEMARGMAQMLAGRLALEIQPNLKFTMNMMVPIEGKVKRTGRALTFTPEKVMGMTPEEARKMGPQGAASIDAMTATLSADGKSLVFSDKKAPEAGTMVFTRDNSAAVARKNSVTAAEKKWLGDWKGSMAGSPDGMSAEQKAQMEQARKALNSTLALTLRQDNTFSLNMMMVVEGKWKVEAGKLRLDITGMGGMGSGTASANEPILLTPASDGSLKAVRNNQVLIFVRGKR